MKPEMKPGIMTEMIIYEVKNGDIFFLNNSIYKPYKSWEDFVEKKEVVWWGFVVDAVNSLKREERKILDTKIPVIKELK